MELIENLNTVDMALPTTVWYADFRVCPCTAVTTVISHMTLYALCKSCVAFPALEAGV